ncbi:response regulator transcription factor [Nocardioides sp. SYSU DS0663]|uniref:response regulator transcription factor n=1 Tax=Nocardioides sp. SYSU DS0663 TaxID=3416445 RepID=UPI003F4C5084
MNNGPREASPHEQRPVRVGVVDESELVTTGVDGMLQRHPDRAVIHEPAGADVVLCDPAGRPMDIDGYLADVRARAGGKVVVYTWRLDQASVRRAVSAGAHGFVSKAASAEDLIEVVELVHRGERVESPLAATSDDDTLSTREAEVLALICRGRSNLEIAAELYVSVNSVKTYIRQIYQKIGVTRRSQAVAWGIGRGY